MDHLGESLQIIKENGGRRVLIPAANVRDLSTVPPDLLSGLDVAFFGDARECVLKAMAA
jgi:predicted ATP-dependent Lon-type protease